MNVPLQGSLRDFDRPADRIRQHRQADKRPVVVLEGISDERLIKEAFRGAIATFPVGTRAVALETGRQLYSWSIKRFSCVVDRDFDSAIDEYLKQGVPVHAYENADLEAMLYFSDALRLLVQEVGSAEKLDAFGGIQVLRQKVAQAVIPIARLRAANSYNGWGLNFDRVDLSDRIDRKTLELNLNGYCDALLKASLSSIAPNISVLLKWAMDHTSHPSPPRCPRSSNPYVRGKDVLAVTGVAMRAQVGSLEKAATHSKHLAGILRAVSCALLPQLAWSQELIAAINAAPIDNQEPPISW
jgi:hypothetical protein